MKELTVKDLDVGNALMWKIIPNTPMVYKAVGKFSSKIQGEPYGYCHCGLINFDKKSVVHAHPPRASVDELNRDFFIKNGKFVLEVWEINGLTEIKKNELVSAMFNVCFKRDKNSNYKIPYKGRMYDWLAIYSFGLLNNPWLLHCAEALFLAGLDIDTVMKPKGAINLTVQPNQLILSYKMNRKGYLIGM